MAFFGFSLQSIFLTKYSAAFFILLQVCYYCLFKPNCRVEWKKMKLDGIIPGMFQRPTHVTSDDRAMINAELHETVFHRVILMMLLGILTPRWLDAQTLPS